MKHGHVVRLGVEPTSPPERTPPPARLTRDPVSYFVVATVDGKDLDWWQFDSMDQAQEFRRSTSGGRIVSFVATRWAPIGDTA